MRGGSLITPMVVEDRSDVLEHPAVREVGTHGGNRGITKRNSSWGRVLGVSLLISAFGLFARVVRLGEDW